MRLKYENNQNINDSISLKINLSRLRIGDTIEFDLIIGCDTIKKQISETSSSPCSYVKYKLDDCIQIGNIHYLVRDFARDESILPYYVASTHLRNIQGYLKLDTKGFNVITIDLNYAINLLESHYSKGEYIVVQDGKVVIWKNQIFKRIINREPLEIKSFIYSLFLSS